MSQILSIVCNISGKISHISGKIRNISGKISGKISNISGKIRQISGKIVKFQAKIDKLPKIQRPILTKRSKFGGCGHVFQVKCTVWQHCHQSQKQAKLLHETHNQSALFITSIKLKTKWLERPYL